MISGAHIIVYSKDAEADRKFFQSVLGFKSVDAGQGWLIFALPPGEAAFHPSDENGPHELYFMCEDLKAEMASLAKKGVQCSGVQEARWGSITKMRLPGGGEVAPLSAEASYRFRLIPEMKRRGDARANHEWISRRGLYRVNLGQSLTRKNLAAGEQR